MQCKEWGDANSELFKEPHDEAVHKNSYKSRLCELISASLRPLQGLGFSTKIRYPLPSGDTSGRALRCSLSVCTANWSHTSEHNLQEQSDVQIIVSR